MKNNRSFFGIFLAGLVLLPGCILRVPSYRRQPLAIVGDNFLYNETQANLNIRAKELNLSEKYYLFDNRSDLSRRNRVRIVYISVNNLTNVDYVLSPNNISVKQVSSADINTMMKKTSSSGRFVVAGVGGLSSAGAGGIVAISSVFAIAGGTAMAIVSAPLLLCGLAQGIKSVVMNARIEKDIKEKTLHKKVIVYSGEQYEGLLFVKSSDYIPQFAITMYENNHVDNSVTFDVNLN